VPTPRRRARAGRAPYIAEVTSLTAILGATLTDLRAVTRLGWLGRTIVVLIVVADLLVVGANLVFLTVDEPRREPTHPVFSNLVWNGDVDNSWMERVGHVQLLGAAVGCVVLRRRHGDAVYLVSAALLAWIVIDDAGRLHEAGGNLFGRLGVSPVAGISAQQLGELAVWALAGLALLPAFVWGLRRAGDQARARTSVLLVGFAVLLVFGMGVDTLDAILELHVNSWIQTALALGENVGELVAIGLITVLVMVQLAGLDHAADLAGPGSATT